MEDGAGRRLLGRNDPGVGDQILARDRLAQGQRMAAPRDDRQRIVEQRLLHDVVDRRRLAQRADEKVDHAVAQPAQQPVVGGGDDLHPRQRPLARKLRSARRAAAWCGRTASSRRRSRRDRGSGVAETSAKPCSSSACASAAWRAKTDAAGVSSTPCRVATNSVAPMMRSRSRAARWIEGCERSSSRAARLKLRVNCIAASARNCATVDQLLEMREARARSPDFAARRLARAALDQGEGARRRDRRTEVRPRSAACRRRRRPAAWRRAAPRAWRAPG